MSEVAILGGGCFWCLEAVFNQTEGVLSAISGYAGGSEANPNYKDVCTGATGHVELVEVTFDPSVISYRDILEIFFVIHDPTTLNRQGNDVGTQYRSVIYYTSENQRQTAQALMDELAAQDAYGAKIVTTLEPAPTFYKAEEYHQHYFEKNPHQTYCAYVVAPKVQKFRKKFTDRIKVAAR